MHGAAPTTTTDAPAVVRDVGDPRVLVVSQSPVVLMGMRALLTAQGMPVAGALPSPARLARAMRIAQATVALVAPPDDVSVELRAALAAVPHAVVLLWDSALLVHGTELTQNAGCACLPLTATGDAVADALRASARPADDPRAVGIEEVAVGPGGRLTAREEEVLAALSRGLANGEIAAHLGVGSETVKSHLKRIYRKLDVASRAEAVAVFLGRGS